MNIRHLAVAAALVGLATCSRSSTPTHRVELRRISGDTLQIIPGEGQMQYCLVFTHSGKGVVRQLTMSKSNMSVKCPAGEPVLGQAYRIPVEEGPVKVNVFFSDKRLELWPNIDRKYYKVHQLTETSADVTEGSRGVWERTHYDWSTPGTVRIQVLDSNAFRPGSYWIYSVVPRPEGGSHVHLEFLRTPRNLKGLLLSALLNVAGRKIFGDFLDDTLHRLERRHTATTGERTQPGAR